MRLTALALSFAVAASSTGGCSFAFVSGPPVNHQQLPYFECTTSRLVPGLDTVWTVLQVLNLGLAIKSNDAEWDDNFGGDAPLDRKPAIGLYTVLAALGAAGMYYGFTKTGECTDAKSQLMTRMMQNQNGGGMQPGTWPGGAPMGPPPGGAPMGPPPGGAPMGPPPGAPMGPASPTP